MVEEDEIDDGVFGDVIVVEFVEEFVVIVYIYEGFLGMWIVGGLVVLEVEYELCVDVEEVGGVFGVFEVVGGLEDEVGDVV